MFVQVIQGKVSDPAAVQAAFDRWVSDLAPSSVGWLGTTAGVTDDGTLICLARFESPEAAQRNNARPEQDQWWAQASSLFSGEVTFADSSDVLADQIGDPDSATFVQVMRGRGTNLSRARELMSEGSQAIAQYRPDILGNVMALHDGGRYTMAIYFTSEKEAREGEAQQPPPEVQARMEELNALNTSPPEFYDLHQPWLYSAR